MKHITFVKEIPSEYTQLKAEKNGLFTIARMIFQFQNGELFKYNERNVENEETAHKLQLMTNEARNEAVAVRDLLRRSWLNEEIHYRNTPWEEKKYICNYHGVVNWISANCDERNAEPFSFAVTDHFVYRVQFESRNFPNSFRIRVELFPRKPVAENAVAINSQEIAIPLELSAGEIKCIYTAMNMLLNFSNSNPNHFQHEHKVQIYDLEHKFRDLKNQVHREEIEAIRKLGEVQEVN